MPTMTRYGPLVAGAAALVAAGLGLARENTKEGTLFAVAMVTLGLVLVGAWLAIEIRAQWRHQEATDPAAGPPPVPADTTEA